MLPLFTINRFSVSRQFTFFFLLFFASVLPARAQQPAPETTGKSSFTARLINLEAASSETFRYTTTLHNGSAGARIYEMKADLPEGWIIAFKVDGSQVTSINMDAGKTQDISIEINPAASAAPKKYTIPVKAVAGADT